MHVAAPPPPPRACPDSGSESGLASATRQPDSLRLSCALSVLRHLHHVAAAIEERYGDKAPDRTFFLPGVQGAVARPSWNREGRPRKSCDGRREQFDKVPPKS